MPFDSNVTKREHIVLVEGPYASFVPKENGPLCVFKTPKAKKAHFWAAISNISPLRQSFHFFEEALSLVQNEEHFCTAKRNDAKYRGVFPFPFFFQVGIPTQTSDGMFRIENIL